ncbi:MAG: hypothetical protein J0L73_19985 [Verrucomicrobia bacterium]|nr:hypothetical protein [Verrucomicrobiota bacterium]
MSFAAYQRQVIAYHGCDQSVVEECFRGGKLNESANDYDWLGNGIYFWEHGPARAMEWAQFMKLRRKVVTPAVVGALIQLGNCFDLLDVRFTDLLRGMFLNFNKSVEGADDVPPVNDPARKLHRLDCAFLNWAIPIVEEKLEVRFQTVRGVFVEGEPLYPSAQIFMHSHIQIAVRDPAAILGFFHPATVDSH